MSQKTTAEYFWMNWYLFKVFTISSFPISLLCLFLHFWTPLSFLPSRGHAQSHPLLLLSHSFPSFTSPNPLTSCSILPALASLSCVSFHIDVLLHTFCWPFTPLDQQFLMLCPFSVQQPVGAFGNIICTETNECLSNLSLKTRKKEKVGMWAQGTSFLTADK